jgi:hypothetical protein
MDHCNRNLNRTSKEDNCAVHMTNDIVRIPSSPADLGSQQTVTLGTPQMIKSGGTRVMKAH